MSQRYKNNKKTLKVQMNTCCVVEMKQKSSETLVRTVDAMLRVHSQVVEKEERK